MVLQVIEFINTHQEHPGRSPYLQYRLQMKQDRYTATYQEPLH